MYRLSEALLSKQDHYDWKLRAVKTTLNVAGGMRRQSPNLPEDRVLLRALRDFNLGKLVADDVDIFLGLTMPTTAHRLWIDDAGQRSYY